MSTELSHTPGPWSWKILPWKSYHKVPEISICNADGQEFIRQSYDTYSDQATLSESDAYLIAAAPEMLDVLKELLSYHTNTYAEWRDETEMHIYMRIKDVIAKAKGEAP